MDKRNILLLLSITLVTFLTACHLPPLAVKSPNPPTAASQGVSSASATGTYTASTSEIAKLHQRYSALGVQPSDIIIPANTSWSGDLPTSRILDLLAARIDYPYPAGGSPAMQVFVNDQVVGLPTCPLLNKSNEVSIADGRTGHYWYPEYQAWALNYSQDFNIDNTSAAGGYQVVSDPGQTYRYVWDVSALMGSAPTMHVRIHNNGFGVGCPIVVRMNLPLKLTVDTPYFSPNGDGVLDTATLSIQATGPWQLSVQGQSGTITTGNGNATYVWDGTLNGTKLPEGSYTLVLAPTSASTTTGQSTGSIVVDTTPPSISDAWVSGIEQIPQDQGGNTTITSIYTISISSLDPQKNGAASGIATDSATVNFANAKFSEYAPPTEMGSHIEVKYKLEDANPTACELKFSATVRDRAGNKSPAYADSFKAKVDETFTISYEPTDGGPTIAVAPTQAQGNPIGIASVFTPMSIVTPISAGGVFYDKSGLIAHIKASDEWTTNNPRMLEGKVVWAINKLGLAGLNGANFYKTCPFTANTGWNQRNFMWDGTKTWGDLSFGPDTLATTGKYRLHAIIPYGWVTVRSVNLIFKVSNHECITAQEWKPVTQPQAHQLDFAAAHTIGQHLMDRRPGSNRPDYYYFWDYDSLLHLPYIDKYSDKNELKTNPPFAITHQLEQGAAYQALMRLAWQVQYGPKSDMVGPTEKGAPVVFPHTSN